MSDLVQGGAFFHGLPIFAYKSEALNPGGTLLSQIGDHSNLPAFRLASAKQWGPMPDCLGLLLAHPPEHPQGQIPRDGLIQ